LQKVLSIGSLSGINKTTYETITIIILTGVVPYPKYDIDILSDPFVARAPLP
jgi:hypothetical protein